MSLKEINKLVASLLACGMLASMMTGCGNAETADSESKATEQTQTSATTSTEKSESAPEGDFNPRSITEGVTLTIAVPEQLKVQDYETNEMTLMIEEALGVNLEFLTFPGTDFESKMNVMVMGGEKLPDIIFEPGSQYTSWVAEGVLLPLGQYYDNPDLSANIRKSAENAEIDVVTALTLPDGEIYALPGIEANPTNLNWQSLWLYEPWLKDIGKEMPETTEEFYEVCKLIAESDLNGNGKKDEIALIGGNLYGPDDGWFRFLMSSFVYAYQGDFVNVEDGTVELAYTTDEWKEGLKYIKRFFDEGLIPEEILSYNSSWSDRSQVTTHLYAEEQVVFSYAYWNIRDTIPERWVEYSHVPALEGPDGYKVAMFAEDGVKAKAVITTDCENPEAAFLVCDYMCNEEMSITTRYGKRGVDWDYWEEANVENKSDYKASYDGYELSIIPYGNDAFWVNPDPQNISYLGFGPAIKGMNIMCGIPIATTTSTQEDEYARVLLEKRYAGVVASKELGPKEQFANAPLTIEETEQINDILATLKTYVNEKVCAFLVGNLDIDAEWDSYLAELENIGYKKLVEVYQTAYSRTH